MTAPEILDHLARSGVRLFLQDGRLRFQAAPGVYNHNLRELVASHRESLVECLQATQNLLAEELQRILQRLAQMQALLVGQPGRATVLQIWHDLAQRWFQESNVKLLEVHPCLVTFQARWQEEDQHQQHHPYPWMAVASTPKSRKKSASRGP